MYTLTMMVEWNCCNYSHDWIVCSLQISLYMCKYIQYLYIQLQYIQYCSAVDNETVCGALI